MFRPTISGTEHQSAVRLGERLGRVCVSANVAIQDLEKSGIVTGHFEQFKFPDLETKPVTLETS